jgi:outer membrane protein, heavy metal efflux system
MKRTQIITIFSLLAVLNLSGQSTDQSVKIPLSLTEYLSGVSKRNLGYISEQFNVSIAEAQLKAAKVFPDPEISVAYSNNEDKTMMMGQGFDAGVSYPFSLGNKRGAAISLAESQKEFAQSAVDAYFQNLRAEAAISYFAVVKQQHLFLLQKDIYERMKKLAGADSLRLVAGAINATDALQTALEARAQKNQVFQAESDLNAVLIRLLQLQGRVLSDTLLLPSEDFQVIRKDFSLPELIKSAIEHRSDLQMAIRNKQVSENQVRLIKSTRAFEFSIDAGYSHSTVVKNDIAPAPPFNSYGAGITIPLKFSSLNKGELEAARNVVSQSETIFLDTQLQITSEVTQAWFQFKALEKQVEQYKNGLVADAEKILDARTYAYQRGETGLIDLLNAQQTFIDLQVEYYETFFQYTESLIELERASGIWDFE